MLSEKVVIKTVPDSRKWRKQNVGNHLTRILDIGTGTGKGTVLLGQKGYAIHCIEPGENLMAISMAKLKIYPQVTFEITTLEDWNLQENSFDLAIFVLFLAKKIRLIWTYTTWPG